MRISEYSADFSVKTLKLGVAFFLGAAAYGFAQSPPAPPALLPLPSIPAPPAAPAAPNATVTAAPAIPPLPDMAPAAPKASTPPAPQTSAIPPLADLPTPPAAPADVESPKADKIAKKDGAPDEPAVPADLVKAVAAEEKKVEEKKEEKKQEAAVTVAPIAPPPLMSLPVPALGSAPTMPPPLPGMATALPEIKVEADKPKQKTWQTELAPTAKVMETNFHYRRQLLPNTIYRREYDDANQHLPKAVTRGDYEGLLFASVAANDLESVRALLNAGTDINARNAEGYTPLSYAYQVGANASAKLLLARGAR